MSTGITKENLGLYNAIDEILWKDWDPIGVYGTEQARGEYQSYLPRIFKLTLEGNLEKLENYLYGIETELMGLQGGRETCKTVVKLIMAAKTKLKL